MNLLHRAAVVMLTGVTALIASPVSAQQQQPPAPVVSPNKVLREPVAPELPPTRPIEVEQSAVAPTPLLERIPDPGTDLSLPDNVAPLAPQEATASPREETVSPPVVAPDTPSAFRSSAEGFPRVRCRACELDPPRGGRCCPRCGCSTPSRWETVTKPRLQATHWGYCDQFCELPFGSSVTHAMGMMVHNGIQQQMVLHSYDFMPLEQSKTPQLSARGQQHLSKLSILLQQGYGPLMIEHVHPAVDAARRQAVMNTLSANGVPVEPFQVLIRARPKHLSGVEGLQLYQKLLQFNQSGGSSGSGGAGAGGAGSNVGTGSSPTQGSR